jgi:hypothetical protein
MPNHPRRDFVEALVLVLMGFALGMAIAAMFCGG